MIGDEMSEQRKKYTPAEKAKIALEAIKGEMTLAQISMPIWLSHNLCFTRDCRI